MNPEVPNGNQIAIKKELDFIIKSESKEESNPMYEIETIKISIGKAGCSDCREKQSQIDAMENQIGDITAKLLQSKVENQTAFIEIKKKDLEIAKLQKRCKGDKQFEVKAITNHKKKKGKMYYQVRWVGYGAEDEEWIEENSLNCPAILQKYKASL